MNKKNKKILIIILLSFFVYRFYFNFISTTFQQVIMYGGMGLYMLMNYHRLLKYFSNMGKFTRIIIIALIMNITVLAATFFIPIIYQTNDFSFFTSNLRGLSYTFSYFIILDLIKTYLEPSNLRDSFMELFVYSSTVYVLFTIVTLLFPSLKSFWLSIIQESERNLYLLENNASYIARFGWAGFSSFVPTFYVSIAVLFNLYLLLKNFKSNNKLNNKYLITLFFLLLGNSFYGRIGLFNSLALIVFSLIYIIIRSNKKHYALFLIGGSSTLFLLLSIIQKFIPKMQYWYNWIMDPIINLLSTGQLNTTSTDHLSSMYFVPTLRTLLFGDGFYAGTLGNAYYMNTDVGFLRPMLFYGIIFLVIGYGISILLAFSISFNNRDNYFLSFMLIFTLFLFEAKGEINLTLLPILYTLFIAEVENRKREINLNNVGAPQKTYEYLKDK